MARRRTKVRYGVVGLGNIAQVAVLPAFANAAESSELAALISSDDEKLRRLSDQYGVEHCGNHHELEDVLIASGAEALYIALPNTLHREYTERAARIGVHVLCEKPMAMTTDDCLAMIAACDDADVKLMVAYRLHFEAANLRAAEIVRSGRIGEARLFSSVFSHSVRGGDIRTRVATGGGALFDLGVYCVNAARMLFGSEPLSVTANQSFEDRHGEESVDRMTSAVLRFPGDRFAQLTANQAAASLSEYRVVGTDGDLRVEQAFRYAADLTHHLRVDGEMKTEVFPARDQFAPELLAFSRCILDDLTPEPSGREGLADVRVLEAIVTSARTGRTIPLEPFAVGRYAGMEDEVFRPLRDEPETVHAPSPTT